VFRFLDFSIRYTFIYSDHSSNRDNDGRYRDRDSHKSNRGGFNRSSSFNRYILIIEFLKIKHDLYVTVSEIVHVHHVIAIDMVLHEMIVHLEVISVEVDEEEEEEEEVVVIILDVVDVEDVVVITIINVNRISHVLVLMIINHHGKIVEEEDVVVAEEVFMIVNAIWAVIIDLMNSCHQVIIQ